LFFRFENPVFTTLKRFQKNLTLTEYYFFSHLSSENTAKPATQNYFRQIEWFLSGFPQKYAHLYITKIEKHRRSAAAAPPPLSGIRKYGKTGPPKRAGYENQAIRPPG
jgi:hypothetical protein